MRCYAWFIIFPTIICPSLPGLAEETAGSKTSTITKTASTADNTGLESQEEQKEPSRPYVLENVPVLKDFLKQAESELRGFQKQFVDTYQPSSLEQLSSGTRPLQENDNDQEAIDELTKKIDELVIRVTVLEAAVLEAQDAPPRAILSIRQQYDGLADSIEAIYNELQFRPEPKAKDTDVLSLEDVNASDFVEGLAAKTIRKYEDELSRIEDLRSTDSIKGASEELLKEMGALEKLDQQLQDLEQELSLFKKQYKTAHDLLFTGYVTYEDKVIEATQLYTQLSEIWDAIEDTKAETYPDEIKKPSSIRNNYIVGADDKQKHSIKALWQSRWSSAKSKTPYSIHRLSGKLKKLQKEIDTREEQKERLAQNYDRLKELEAEKGGSSVSSDDAKKNASSGGIKAAYLVLSGQIEALQANVEANHGLLISLGEEKSSREEVVQSQKEKEAQAESELQILVKSYESVKSDKTVAFPTSASNTRAKQRKLLAVALREKIAAHEIHLQSIRRKTRLAEIKFDVVNRKILRIEAEIEQLTKVRLPKKRQEYYIELARTAGIRAVLVILVFLLAWLALRFLKVNSQPFIEGFIRRHSGRTGTFGPSEQQRARTLLLVLMGSARLIVYITAVLFAIGQFDVDYGPLLVAAGGLSLAIGFGAQSLVADFFAGFFILLEGQYSIGDVVDVNGKKGVVEDLNLRTTVIRSLNGDVHTLPNGEISVTTNMTKQWSRAVVDVGVAYEEDVDQVGQVLEALAREMSLDEIWGGKLLSSSYLGVETLGDSSVVHRVLLQTRPGEQWGVSREFQRRVKVKFDELGIEIPWPQRVISYKDETDQSFQAKEDMKRQKIAAFLLPHADAISVENQGISVEEKDRLEMLAKQEQRLDEEDSDTQEDVESFDKEKVVAHTNGVQDTKAKSKHVDGSATGSAID